MEHYCRHCKVKLQPASPSALLSGKWWYAGPGPFAPTCSGGGHEPADPLVELLKEMSHGPRTG